MTQQPQGVQPDRQSQLAQLSPRQGDAAALTPAPIQQQSAELIRILSDQETGATYKSSLDTTVNLVKLTTALLLRSVITAFAAAVWVWGFGFQLGRHFRQWIEETGPSSEQIVCNLLWAVTRPFVALHQWATSFLGWENPLPSLDQGAIADRPTDPATPLEAEAIDVQPLGDS